MVTEQEIKNWYNEKHLRLGEKAWRPLSEYSIFLEHLKAEPNKKLLDVGCGTGNTLRQADLRGLNTFGVDISEEGVKIAKQTSPNSTIVLGKAESLDFPDNYFDYIVCVGAMEHFLDMDKGISEMARVAKKDASFCIVVPNVDWLLYKKMGVPGTDQQDINENLLTLDKWKAFFSNHNFKIKSVYRDMWGKKLIEGFVRGKSISEKIYYKILWGFLPMKYNYQFIFILKLDE